MLDKVKRNQILIVILGVIVLTVLVIGITYAGFSLTTSSGNNSISSGTITMSFQEPSNNVVITNAMPTSNGYSSTTHFDFSVTGTAKTSLTIPYEISITEKSGNTIDPNYVRIGLKKNGTIVDEFASGKLAGTLMVSEIQNDSKILVKDQLTLTQSGSNYTATDNYQLFLWLTPNYPMPSDGSTESYSITVNINSNVEEAGIVYGITTKYVVSSTTMNIGSTLPNGVNGRNTAALAMNDWALMGTGILQNKPFYLKHVLNNSNNKIEESYVGFIVTSDMVTSNPGMIEGTYTLRGGDSGLNYTANVNTIKAAFGYDVYPSRCTDSTTYFSCQVQAIHTTIYLNGKVTAYDPSYNCTVNSNGSSKCGGDSGSIAY